MTTAKRLPAVQSLSAILPAGTESGKEFARIVGLLFFKDARANGYEYSIFDDASGDYQGLDGFSRKPGSEDIIGYQYKFFSSPLSNSHRQEIKKSLKNALERTENHRLKKWVLVTPDDFKNSALREGGGDVTWFEKLREDFREEVEIEHVGHTKLISFFLESYNLCLFYYPLLVPQGNKKKKTIQELRSQYDENMRTRYGRVEFVGMPVYKEGTVRRIPLEEIYIALSVVNEKSEEEEDSTPRIDPISFLAPGSKTMILGDPGAGKSTLVSFLALVGINKSLQKRCRGKVDSRLTIVITLRRYADELKLRKNLSLLEYVCESVKADFNMPDIDIDFFSFYIESGQAIVFFDGLDELPTKDYKGVVRQRVESFNQNYPVNTILLTSRLVGYEAEVRFDVSFNHYRMAKLRLIDIEKFIYDWYSLRVDDPGLMERNVADLKKIIKSPDSDSIRALAGNPLLLTIVALVHRIDAVLPDERVVLYQKCTETLLNTWYKAKRQDEEVSKGRIERRNRLRVESIAYWMHKNSAQEKGRAVVSREELLRFLTDFISTTEVLREQDEPAEDQAESFIAFIKNTAGLFVEAGDGIYSFIHLTFQEYLSATHLRTFGERDGASATWAELSDDIQNPKWREVIRLFVASMHSTSTQEFFVSKLLEYKDTSRQRDNVMLLLGLLNDSIEPAECRSIDIISRAISMLLEPIESNDARILVGLISRWGVRTPDNARDISAALKLVLKENEGFRLKILLIYKVLEVDISPLDYKLLKGAPGTKGVELFSSIIMGDQSSNAAKKIASNLLKISTVWSEYSPDSNAVAAVVFCMSLLIDGEDIFKKVLVRELLLLTRGGLGPYHDNGMNLRSLVINSVDVFEPHKKALSTYRKRNNPLLSNRKLDGLGSSLKKSFKSYLSGRGLSDGSIDDLITRMLLEIGVPQSVIDHHLRGTDQVRHSVRPIQTMFFNSIYGEREDELSTAESYWDMLRGSESFMSSVYLALEGSSAVKIDAIWSEAIKLNIKNSLPKTLSKLFDSVEVMNLCDRFEAGASLVDDAEYAAVVIVQDIWNWSKYGYSQNEESPVLKLMDLSKGLPLVDFAIALREAALGIKGSKGRLTSVIKVNQPELQALFSIIE